MPAASAVVLRSLGGGVARCERLEVKLHLDSPTVTSSQFLWKDLPQRYVIEFDQHVTAVAAEDFEVLNLDTDQPEPFVLEGYDPLTHKATLRFLGEFENSGMLASGNYQLRIRPGAVSSAATGELMTAAHEAEFFFLWGDADHNRVVDGTDYAILDNSYVSQAKTFPELSYYENGDFDYSTTWDSTDYSLIDAGYMIHLVEPTDFYVVARSLAEDPNIGIRVSWNADPAVHQWRVERNSYDGNGYVPISGWLDSSTSFYDDSNLADGTWYSYRVRGRDTSGNLIAYTPQRGDYTVLPGPGDVGAALLADNQIGLWWTDNSSSEARFVIEWAPAGTNFDPAQIQSLVVGSDQTTAVVSAPQSLANVELRVRAEIDGPVQSTPRNANPPSEVAYTDDFSGEPGGRTGFLNPIWTNARYDWAAPNRRFLGLYQDETVGLYLPNLPPHAKINLWVSFLGWNYGGGGYELTLRADGQEYTADEWLGWGYAVTNSRGPIGMQRVHYSIPHISSQVALTFSGSGYQALSSYWGMWDIQVMLEYPIVSFFQSEGQYAEEGGRHAELYVMRTADLTYPLDIPFSVLNGTAQSEDYQLQPSGSLHLDSGQGMATITASAADDSTPEWTEDFLVRLGGSRRYFLDPVSAGRQRKVEIVDNNDGSILGLPDVLEVNNDDDDDSGEPDMDQNDYDADGYPDWDNVPSLSGEDELYPIQLDFPQAPKPGATVSLSRGNNSPIRVMQSNDRGGIAFINEDRGSYTWTLGQNDPPRTVWVEAIGGSASEGDVVLTLTYDDSTATTRPIHHTSATTTSQPATNVKLAIMFRGQDVTARRSPDVLIGEKIDPTLEIGAPPGWLPPADGYTWVIPGPTFKDYIATAELGKVIALGPDDVKHQSVTFYWSDATTTGVERTVYVATTINGVIYQRYTRFRVYEPTVSVFEDRQNPVGVYYFGSGASSTLLGLGGPGMAWRLSVQVPAAFQEGHWSLVQIVNYVYTYRIRNADDLFQSGSHNGLAGLDSGFPYPFNGGWHSTGAVPQPQAPRIVDSPGFVEPTYGPYQGKWYQAEMDFSTWIMFRPTNGVPVPLKRENWGWRGQFNLNADPPPNTAPWSVNTAYSAQWANGLSDSAEFPVWTRMLRKEDARWV